MKLFRVGEKSKAICEQCSEVRLTTFRERSIPLSSGKGLVPDVLVAVCDTCDTVVSIPQQSVPRIQEVVRFSRHPIEARVPRHLMDALGLACHELGYGVSEQATLFRYYIQHIGNHKATRRRLAALAASADAAGKADARFSIKLNDELYEVFRRLEKDIGLNKAELVKAIIVQMKKDLLDSKNLALRESLRGILLLAG